MTAEVNQYEFLAIIMAVVAISALGWPVQPVDATLSVLKGKDGVRDETSRVFRGFTAAEKPGTLASLAVRARPWDFKPQQKE